MALMQKSRRLLWRTIRQRGRRATAGQVSAIVTIFALLLLVSFIANFVLLQLPAQEAELEFEHTLLVENQLSRLQSTILSQALNPKVPLPLASPVTLSPAPDPPFGVVSTGSIQGESIVAHSVASYTLARVVPHNPSWENGSSCLGPLGGHCTSGGPVYTWNETFKNNTTVNIKVDSNFKSLVYNLSAANDTININYIGGDTGFIAFIINGSHDSVNFLKSGSDVNSPVIAFLFYGQFDSFSAAFSGSHSGKGSDLVFVQFVGELSLLCPYGNLSSTDTLGSVTGTANNINFTAVWWNNIGYASSPHTFPMTFGTNDTATFENLTGFVSCPFTIAYISTFQAQYLGGFLVHLNHQFLGPEDLVYDQGAIIAAPANGIPVMVSPPSFSAVKLPGGIAVRLTLVNIFGNVSSLSGVGTATISTQVIGSQTYSVTNFARSGTFLTSPFLNVTTAYPRAWLSWFGQQLLAFPNGVACIPLGVIKAPYTCTSPAPGQLVELSAPLLAGLLTVTTISVEVSVS